MDNLKTLILDFANRLQGLIEADALERARGAVLSAMGMATTKRLGRPPKASASFSGAPRRNAPKQMCPVPYCRNPAAPVFGMVCAKHKDVPKAKIRKYREARKARKLKNARAGGP